MRILFMGTPSFAVTALQALHEKYKEDIVGVVTKVDVPKNRGHAMLPPEVKVAATSLSLPVFQPENLKEENFKDTLEMLAPDVIIVAAYGKLLPEYVLNYPKYGCINIHASLLPEYRGAAPIARAIMDGKRKIGVTIMYMEKGLDTGDMLASRALDFENGESKGEIEEKLAHLGADILLEELRKIESGTPSPRIKQDDSLASYASKIEKSDCVIDFTDSADMTVNKIRALCPAPTAFTKINGRLLKITKAHAEESDADAPAGTVIAVNPKGAGEIKVAAGIGTLVIERLIPEGKKEMSAGDFVRGRGIAVGDIFSEVYA